MAAPTSSADRRRILDREEDDQAGDEQREEGGDRDHEEVDGVDLPRHATEACCGNSGSVEDIVRFGAPGLPPRPCRVAPEADRQEREERQHGQRCRPGGPGGARRRRTSRSPGRSGSRTAGSRRSTRADSLVRRLDQSEPQIARRELDAEEVARDVALRRQHLDRRAVRVLLDRRVVGVAEADRVGQRLIDASRAGQEVPAVGGVRPAVALEVGRLLLRRQPRALARIEADGDDVELAARLEVQRPSAP